ncbi:MAG: hypothetical protein KTR24_08615 [Saprospiraceae bacterium]|nr:hypothetical protein [Saprospiraceae bacterium]
MDYYDQIAAYKSGRLSDAERGAFERAMSADPDLTEAVEKYQILEPFVDLLAEEGIRAEMQKIIDEESSASVAKPARNARTRRMMLWRIAGAAAALALLLGYFFLKPPAAKSDQVLFAEYYDHYTGKSTPRKGGTQGTLDTVTVSAAEATYIEAHRLLDPQQSPGPQRARELLQQIENPESDLRRDEIEWHIAISYLLEGDRARTIDLLENLVANPEQRYLDKATRFLKELKESN